MAVDVSYTFLMSPQETLTGADGATSPVVTFDAFNTRGRLTASSTPPATKVICKTIALSGGAYTLDLTTETGTNGSAIAGTGLRVQLIRVTNLGANAMTFSEGASNGLALACGTFIVPAGGTVQMFLNDAAPDIASGDRTIDVAGTGSQQFQLTVILG
jgi:hypothetical protein